MKHRFSGRLLAIIVLFGYCSVALADESLNVDESRLLIHGYDPVSYFDADPQPGSSRIAVEYRGARIYFSSVENMVKFKSSPDRYMPNYGGYCSYGVRMGQKFDIDPLTYQVSGDQLYLLMDRSTKALWDRNREHNIGIADRIWNSINQIPAAALAVNQE